MDSELTVTIKAKEQAGEELPEHDDIVVNVLPSSSDEIRTATDITTATTESAAILSSSTDEIATDVTTPTTTTAAIFSLTFRDFSDLQTRLVLLPCTEDEGAIVASYTAEEGDDDDEAMTKEAAVGGATLAGIMSDHADEDKWRQMDFTDILKAIREAETPIVLWFVKDEDDDKDERGQDDHPSKQDDHPSKQVDDENINSIEDVAVERSTLDRLSSWGSRVRATANIAASAVAESVATAATERRAAQQQLPNNSTTTTATTSATEASVIATMEPQNDTTIVQQHQQQPCRLYLQTCFDKFEPLTITNGKVTTSSVISVRRSELQACPIQGYSFQWFRAVQNINKVETSSDRSEDQTQRMGWALLKGATYAAYQPTATDVGHQLKCIVTIQDEKDTDAQHSRGEMVVSCETKGRIHADMALFNGARQALGRGAQFSNLMGRGNAKGRIFRVQIEIAMTDKTTVLSATTISQVSGSTSEPLHSKPILQISAVSDPCNPKCFDLVFPKGLQESAGMVSALASNDGRLELEAPNRLTRETLLLSLGIANFNGKPADLTTSTVLFDDTLHLEEIITIAPVTPAREMITEPPLEFFTPLEENKPVTDTPHVERSLSLVDDRVRNLELELQHLLSKMTRKDKVVSDLQRQVAHSESQRLVSEKTLASCQQELRNSRDESSDLRSTILKTQNRMAAQDAMMRRLQDDHKLQIGSLETRIMDQTGNIAQLEKNVRSLQNEKAVLTAGIEARESKLHKMDALQATVDSLSSKLASSHTIHEELKKMHQLHREQAATLLKSAASEDDSKRAVEEAQKTIEILTTKLQDEQKKNATIKIDLNEAKNMHQILKSERNSYKQKAESLTKEIALLCRKGRTLHDVQRILADEDSRITEIEILKTQKKKALEDLTEYRIAYQQSLVTQLKSRNVNGSAMKAMEKICELERVILELTEYVNAKEMQLETVMQVNHALTEEVNSLAKANMEKNDI